MGRRVGPGGGLAATGRDVDHFLTSFAGETGAMAAYLIEEVLAGLDHDALEFMLVTCVAERLTPELAQRLWVATTRARSSASWPTPTPWSA